MHGDLPLISAEQIQHLLDAHHASRKPAISISPDSAMQGTNCMLCSPPDVIDFHYGEGSLQKHSLTAENRNVAVNVVPQPGLACDIDNPADLNELLASKQTLKHSFRYLQDSGIAGRLSAMAIGNVAIASAVGEAER